MAAHLSFSSSRTAYDEDAGYDFSNGTPLCSDFLNATPLAPALAKIDHMLQCKKVKITDTSLPKTLRFQGNTACVIILGYTTINTNAVLSDAIRFIVQHRMVDCVVLSTHELKFELLRSLSNNPELYNKHLKQKVRELEDICRADPLKSWSSSDVIEKLGYGINDEKSIIKVALDNQVPIVCPNLHLLLNEFVSDPTVNPQGIYPSTVQMTFRMDNRSEIIKIKQMVQNVHDVGIIVMGETHIKERILRWTNKVNCNCLHKVFIASKEVARGSLNDPVYGDPSSVFTTMVLNVFAKYK